MDLPVWMTGMGLAGHQKPLNPGPSVMSVGPSEMNAPGVGTSPMALATGRSSPSYLSMFQPNQPVAPTGGSTMGNPLAWSAGVMPPTNWGALSNDALLPPGPANPASAVSTSGSMLGSGSLFPREDMTAFVNDYQAPTTNGGNSGAASGTGWGEMPFMNKAQVVLGGIGTLGNLWSAFQANKIAKDSLDFQKKAYKENLTNSRQSYNTALEDRAASRQGFDSSYDADAYVARNKLG